MTSMKRQEGGQLTNFFLKLNYNYLKSFSKIYVVRSCEGFCFSHSSIHRLFALFRETVIRNYLFLLFSAKRYIYLETK